MMKPDILRFLIQNYRQSFALWLSRDCGYRLLDNESISLDGNPTNLVDIDDETLSSIIKALILRVNHVSHNCRDIHFLKVFSNEEVSSELRIFFDSLLEEANEDLQGRDVLTPREKAKQRAEEIARNRSQEEARIKHEKELQLQQERRIETIRCRMGALDNEIARLIIDNYGNLPDDLKNDIEQNIQPNDRLSFDNFKQLKEKFDQTVSIDEAEFYSQTSYEARMYINAVRDRGFMPELAAGDPRNHKNALWTYFTTYDNAISFDLYAFLFSGNHYFSFILKAFIRALNEASINDILDLKRKESDNKAWEEANKIISRHTFSWDTFRDFITKTDNETFDFFLEVFGPQSLTEVFKGQSVSEIISNIDRIDFIREGNRLNAPELMRRLKELIIDNVVKKISPREFNLDERSFKKFEKYFGYNPSNDIFYDILLNEYKTSFPQAANDRVYIFQFTHLYNAIDILNEKKIYSRSELVRLNKQFTDSASQKVVNQTQRAHPYARFYYWPQTPTQYWNECLGGQEEGNGDFAGAKCPLPVFLVFDLHNVLKEPNVCYFSTGNAQRRTTRILPVKNNAREMSADYLYSRGAIRETDPEKDEKLDKRQREFLVESAFDFKDIPPVAIVCFDEPQKTLLLENVPDQYKHLIVTEFEGIDFFHRRNKSVMFSLSDEMIRIRTEYVKNASFVFTSSSLQSISITESSRLNQYKNKIEVSSYNGVCSVAFTKPNFEVEVYFQIKGTNKKWLIYKRYHNEQH